MPSIRLLLHLFLLRIYNHSDRNLNPSKNPINSYQQFQRNFSEIPICRKLFENKHLIQHYINEGFSL